MIRILPILRAMRLLSVTQFRTKNINPSGALLDSGQSNDIFACGHKVLCARLVYPNRH